MADQQETASAAPATSTTTTTTTSSETSAAPVDTEITRFYKNKNVLITGATGFLGKVLLWKLLNSCPSIGKIYVLLRAKNNLSADKRLIQMLKAQPFSFKHEYTELLQKVVAIESDITAPGLALSQSDRSLLEDQVHVVFHCAASVRFDAPLRDNMRDNYYGTREMVNLCATIKHLAALVHVSTAYSNCHQDDIPEALSPLRLDVDKVVSMIEALPDETLDAVTDKIIEGRPNTYTYTKALAEHCVAKEEGKYPIAIVRPSIVIASNSEPCCGWVDNVNGMSGLGCLAAIGMLRTIDWDYYATSDIVPVDYVANSLICTARQVALESRDKLLVYNMTSGNLNPVSWGVYFEKLRSVAVTTPPTKIVRPMIHSPKYKRANPVSFFMIKFFSELLFAYVLDMLLVLLGYKKIMIKITRKMHHGYAILKPFTTKEWNFDSTNVVNLIDSLSEQDRKTFHFDLRKIDWDEQAWATWHGGRTFLLKEEPTQESYNLSMKRQTVVTFVHYAGMVLIAASFALMGYAGFSLMRA